MGQLKNVPRLRFPGFEEPWTKKSIGEIGTIITGSTPPTANDEFYNGEFQFVSPFDIDEKRFIEQTKTTLTKLGFDKGRRIRKGSSLFVCIGSTIGKVGQIKVDCISNQQINAVVPNENSSDNFIYSLLERHSPEIKMLAGEQAVPIINKSTFLGYSLKLPSISEQFKISSFLLEIDELLAQLKKKKSLLEQYKKGVMQQLFSQELRFKDKDGNDFPDWLESKIGKLCEFKNGYSFKSENYVENGSFKIVTIANVQNGRLDISNCNRMDYLPQDIQEHQILQLGDLLVSLTGNVGRVCLVSENECLLNQRVGKLVPIGITKNFLFHVLRSVRFLNEMILLAQGGAQPNLGKGDVENFVIPIPCTKEQQKIASFLTSLDDKIAQTAQQIEKMKLWKKGLLQQMFV